MAKKKTTKPVRVEAMKDTFAASLAFWLSLGFWIPLFNIGFAAVSIWQGIHALKLINIDPEQFGGRGRAIAGIIISITAIVLTLAGIVIFGLRQLNCGPLDLSTSLI